MRYSLICVVVLGFAGLLRAQTPADSPAPGPNIERFFQAIDANQDGSIDRTELRARLPQIMERMRNAAPSATRMGSGRRMEMEGQIDDRGDRKGLRAMGRGSAGRGSWCPAGGPPCDGQHGAGLGRPWGDAPRARAMGPDRGPGFGPPPWAGRRGGAMPGGPTGPRGVGRGMRQGETGAPVGVLRALDVNGDGVLDGAEIDQAAESLRKLKGDRNALPLRGTKNDRQRPGKPAPGDATP
ncbi:MAG: hypothetical protein JXA69_04595 [Phycisphaerae bacterium]|nr:hypothetical protein [Phycisphaerae bacterium]